MNANPLLTSVGVHCATFLHLYVSDLSGTSTSVTLNWWLIADMPTTLTD